MTRTTFLSGASACLVAGAFVAVTGAGIAGAQPTSETFSFTGSSEDFTVPQNVCEITVDAFGAEAGTATSTTPFAAMAASAVGPQAPWW